MKVRLLQEKNLHPRRYKPNDIAEIPDNVARRWIDRKIAEPLVKSAHKPKPVLKTEDKVTVVILVKDALDYFKICLNSVIKYTVNYELIIVDNGSNEKTKSYLHQQQQIYGFTLITNSINKGFSYGNNQAIKISNCDYICFLNSDTVVTKNWLSDLMEGFKYPDAGIIGASTCYCGDDQCIRSLMPVRMKMTVEDINAVKLDPGVAEIDPMGFCYLVSKKVIDKIGVFDWKRYGLGLSEEKDYNYRAKKAGFKLYWIKQVYIHHWGNQTFKAIGIDPYSLLSKNRAILKDRIKNDPNIFIQNDAVVENIVKGSKKKTGIIIPIVDRNAETEATLKAIFKNNHEELFEIFIIDNGSENVQYLKNYNVKIIKNSKNPGVTKSLNQGIKLTKSKFIILMHNDIKIDTKNWIVKAINFMEENPEVGAVGQAGWKKIRSDGMCGRDALRTSIEKYSSKPAGDFEEVIILDGCCNVLRNIGVELDENLGYYFYDFDMSLQYRSLGYKAFVMNGSAVHFADDRKRATINLAKCKRSVTQENLFWRKSIDYFLNKWGGILPLEVK